MAVFTGDTHPEEWATPAQTITPDDVARWFSGAAVAVAALLPDNEDGKVARAAAAALARHARRSLEAAEE